jgi:hypothetical protein
MLKDLLESRHGIFTYLDTLLCNHEFTTPHGNFRISHTVFWRVERVPEKYGDAIDPL